MNYTIGSSLEEDYTRKFDRLTKTILYLLLVFKKASINFDVVFAFNIFNCLFNSISVDIYFLGDF